MKKFVTAIILVCMMLSMAACGGSGGGKPDSAMGGCKNVLKLDDAMAAVDDYVNEHARD